MVDIATRGFSTLDGQRVKVDGDKELGIHSFFGVCWGKKMLTFLDFDGILRTLF